MGEACIGFTPSANVPGENSVRMLVGTILPA